MLFLSPLHHARQAQPHFSALKARDSTAQGEGAPETCDGTLGKE